MTELDTFNPDMMYNLKYYILALSTCVLNALLLIFNDVGLIHNILVFHIA